MKWYVKSLLILLVAVIIDISLESINRVDTILFKIDRIVIILVVVYSLVRFIRSAFSKKNKKNQINQVDSKHDDSAITDEGKFKNSQNQKLTVNEPLKSGIEKSDPFNSGFMWVLIILFCLCGLYAFYDLVILKIIN